MIPHEIRTWKSKQRDKINTENHCSIIGHVTDRIYEPLSEYEGTRRGAVFLALTRGSREKRGSATHPWITDGANGSISEAICFYRRFIDVNLCTLRVEHGVTR